MTTADALLCSILSSPQDDLPRMVYADFLEESGDAARSEFIRVQVELARKCTPHQLANLDGIDIYLDIYLDPQDSDQQAWKHNVLELRRRERELHPQGSIADIQFAGMLGIDTGRASSPSPPVVRWEYHRGFISSATCSWQDWLAHHAALYWHPKQTEECSRCCGLGVNTVGIGNRPFSTICPDCTDGLIPRPFVNTAMPLESLRLTTWPGGTPQPTYTGSFQIDAETRFDRVKCGTCEGTGLNRLRTPSTNRDWNQPCPECVGTVPKWTCDRWPGVTFKMPEAIASLLEFVRRYAPAAADAAAVMASGIRRTT